MKKVIQFGLVGVLNTIIHYGLFMLLSSIGVNYIFSYFVGFVVSVLNGFFFGYFFVFTPDKKSQPWWIMLLKVYLSYITGFTISTVLMWLWVDIIVLGQYFLFLEPIVKYLFSIISLECSDCIVILSKTIGFCINFLITFPINYTMNSKWAYR